MSTKTEVSKNLVPILEHTKISRDPCPGTVGAVTNTSVTGVPTSAECSLCHRPGVFPETNLPTSTKKTYRINFEPSL